MSGIDKQDRFTELATEAMEPLRRYLARRTDSATADDVLSETLLVCWRRVDEIPAEAPIAWSIGVARLCLSNAERSQRRQYRLARKITTVDPPAQSWDQIGDADESGSTDRVAAALARLPESDAEVLRLWAWDEMTPAEIAVVLDITANTAGVRLHRAKQKLRSQLEDQAQSR